MHSSEPPFWLFLLSPGTTCWIQMLVILTWVEYLARSRMARNGSLRTAVVLSGLLSVDTAPQNERCWQPSPCVYNFAPTCAALDSLFGRTTSLLSGFTGLKIEGMMARWLHTLQQFQFTIVHRAGRDHSNADGLSRVPTSPCGQCTAPVWTRRWK